MLTALVGALLAILQSSGLYSTVRTRVLIGLIVTAGVAFLLGFAASCGVFGSHGWAVALIIGASICAAVAVALAPLNRRRPRAHRLHLLRR